MTRAHLVDPIHISAVMAETLDTLEHMQPIPDNTRVRSIPRRHLTGITTPQTINGFYRVLWDDGTITHEAPGMIEPIPE